MNPSQEFEDDAGTLARGLEVLVRAARRAESVVVFAGAGISSHCIPTFVDMKRMGRPPLVQIGQTEKMLDYKMPSFAHRAVACLLEQRGETFRHVSTSNHDGLFSRAGVPQEQLSEIFGCVYTEQCMRCGAEFRREVVVPPLGRVCDHDGCGGALKKIGTRFGAATPAEPLARAIAETHRADLAIVLGSSMSVSPFCEIPAYAKKMVLVTRQQTSYDAHPRTLASIHAPCDMVMRTLCEALSVDVTPSVQRLRFVVSATDAGTRDSNTSDEEGDVLLRICGPDGDSAKNPPVFVDEAQVEIASSNNATTTTTLSTGTMEQERNGTFTARLKSTAADTWADGKRVARVVIAFKEQTEAEPVTVTLPLATTTVMPQSTGAVATAAVDGIDDDGSEGDRTTTVTTVAQEQMLTLERVFEFDAHTLRPSLQSATVVPSESA